MPPKDEPSLAAVRRWAANSRFADKVNIGRASWGGIFNGALGNDVTPTMPYGTPYETWAPVFRERLLVRMRRSDGLVSLLRAIRGRKLWCPGCRTDSCKEGICHGAVIAEMAEWLETTEGRSQFPIVHGEFGDHLS